MQGRLRAVRVLLLYLALAFAWTGRTWAAPTTHLIGTPGFSDAPQLAWELAWVPYAVTHHLNPLFTHLINYPTGANLTWPIAPMPLALLGWPLSILAGPVVAYNVLLTLAIATAA
ncbi:hypothetical protein B1B_17356, partial [mine drainage metagenome]